MVCSPSRLLNVWKCKTQTRTSTWKKKILENANVLNYSASFLNLKFALQRKFCLNILHCPTYLWMLSQGTKSGLYSTCGILWRYQSWSCAGAVASTPSLFLCPTCHNQDGAALKKWFFRAKISSELWTLNRCSIRKPVTAFIEVLVFVTILVLQQGQWICIQNWI